MPMQISGRILDQYMRFWDEYMPIACVLHRYNAEL